MQCTLQPTYYKARAARGSRRLTPQPLILPGRILLHGGRREIICSELREISVRLCDREFRTPPGHISHIPTSTQEWTRGLAIDKLRPARRGTVSGGTTRLGSALAWRFVPCFGPAEARGRIHPTGHRVQIPRTAVTSSCSAPADVTNTSPACLDLNRQRTMQRHYTLVLLGALTPLTAVAAGSLPRGVGPECQSIPSRQILLSFHTRLTCFVP